jgi:hypothetical protein
MPLYNIAKQITLGTTLIISNLEKMTLQHTFKHIVNLQLPRVYVIISNCQLWFVYKEV